MKRLSFIVLSLTVVLWYGSECASAAYRLDSALISVSNFTWQPVDFDDDGIWELGIATHASPTQIGLFDVRTRQWIDGPHTRSSFSDKWGVVDLTLDGRLEYGYFRSDTLRVFDPWNQTDSAYWIAPFVPDGAQFFGHSQSGAPVVALLRGSSHYTETVEYGFIQTAGGSYSFLHLYEIQSGQFVDSMPGGFGRIENGLLAIGQNSLSMYQGRYEWDDSFLGRYDSFVDSIHIIGADWSRVSNYQYRKFGGWVGGGPPRTEYLSHSASSPAHGMTPGCLIFEMADLFESDGSTKVGCLPAGTDSPTWLRPRSTTYRSPYRDFAVFDLDDDGEQECYMPLRDTEIWEVRELDSGFVTDSLFGMPDVNLRTGPLLELGQQNLFYFIGSTLYFYSPEVPTGVFDEPESPPSVDAQLQLAAQPNPFNSAVTLSWTQAAPSARVTIYDVLGRRVFEADVSNRTGMSWDGQDEDGGPLSSGVYLVRLKTAISQAVTKIVLLR